ncbi:MAG: hypothetical protein ACLTBD_09185 [Clostridia bacterium]
MDGFKELKDGERVEFEVVEGEEGTRQQCCSPKTHNRGIGNK